MKKTNMFRLICIAIGYLIGCVQSAYIVSKMWHKDIRKYGSGNLGSTNALRVLGKKAGAITFAGDILKAVLAYNICRIIFNDSSKVMGVYACAGVILGHDFPFYLKFKGGKGIAATIGMMLCIGGWPALIAYLIGGSAVLISKYVSLGSIMFSALIPILLFIFRYNSELIIISLFISVLNIYRHKANIKRIISGNENKLKFKKITFKGENIK